MQSDDYASFSKINTRLLNTPTPLRNVPIRIYVPSSPNDGTTAETTPGSFKVVQILISPRFPNSEWSIPVPRHRFSSTLSVCLSGWLTPPARTPGTQQTLGAALKAALPTLFPSSRDPVLANVVLHGGPVPFRAPLEELMREAAYPDGWLCLCVVLL